MTIVVTPTLLYGMTLCPVRTRWCLWGFDQLFISTQSIQGLASLDLHFDVIPPLSVLLSTMSKAIVGFNKPVQSFIFSDNGNPWAVFLHLNNFFTSSGQIDRYNLEDSNHNTVVVSWFEIIWHIQTYTDLKAWIHIGTSFFAIEQFP